MSCNGIQTTCSLFLLNANNIFQMDIGSKPSTQGKEEEELSDEKLEKTSKANKTRVELSKQYDQFFKTSTLIFIVAGVVICLYNIPTFRQYSSAKGHYIIQLSTFWWSILGFFVSFIGRKVLHYSASNYFQAKLHPKVSTYSQADQRERLLIIIKQTYEALYHLITSIVCFYIFYKEEWFPSCLGGFGRCDLILQSWPAWPQNKEGLIAFYNFQLGTYIFLTLDLVVFDYERFKTKNFGQLFFHHFITILLIVFSISYSFVGIGVLIFFVHEISDFFRGIARIIGQSWTCIYFPQLANAMNYFSLVVWIYTRLIVFPFCLINEMYEGFEGCYNKTPFLAAQGVYLIILCCAIYAIQCYWAVLIYSNIQKEKEKNEPYVANYLQSKQAQEKSKKN